METDADIQDSIYLEVYPAQFTVLEFSSYLAMENELNWFEVKFQPNTDFLTTDYFIIEIPIESLEGQPL